MANSNPEAAWRPARTPAIALVAALLAPVGWSADEVTAGQTATASSAAKPADNTVSLEERVRVLEELLAKQQSAGQAYREEGAFAEQRLATPDDEPNVDYDAIDSGGLVPGKGAKVYSGKDGELFISAYALFRAINQQPSNQVETDHLGRTYTVDPRVDMNLHRAMVHFKGWLYDERFRYALTTWTVNATEQVRLIGNLTYVFDDSFILSGGINGLPGARTLNNSHPYWLGHDRVMADEFFRPGFTAGVSAAGELPGELNYRVMVGNNISQLGIPASKMTRDLAVGATLVWQPTTGEFGPQGGYGDFEFHENIATRFGVSATSSREDRFNQPDIAAPDNTQITLQDGLYLFEQDALVADDPNTIGVTETMTLQKATYKLFAVDAGVKWRGMFAQTEIFHRSLDEFQVAADVSNTGVPVDSIRDHGYSLQTAFFPIPKKLEVYASTSTVWGDEDAGYSKSWEYILGSNWFWSGTRNQRVNLQVIDVHHSPVRSSFGYYGKGLDGITMSLDVSMMF